MKKIITLLFSVSILSASAQCVMTGNATPDACSPTTNTYSVTGFVGYFNPPTTGTLIISSSCGGTPVVIPPPFTGSTSSYTIPGITADGASCTVTFFFSDLPTCMYTAMYTAPAACMATSVADNTFLADLNISPNPSTGSINLSFNQPAVQSTTIEIIDVLGRSIYTQALQNFIGEYSQKVDLTAFNKGIYFVKISGEKGSEIRKIIYH